MRVTVSVGPGPYSGDFVRALAANRILHRVIYAWPRFEVWGANRQGQLEKRATFPAYDNLVRVTWAVWTRLPHWKRYQTPKAFLYALFDSLAAGYVDDCDIFWGWSQVSLKSLRRAKSSRRTVVLEHPMAHAETWMSLMQEEYMLYGKSAPLYNSLLPRPLVRRMKREYQAADRINLLSTYSAQTFTAHDVSAAKLTMTPLGIDTDLFRPMPRAEDKPFRILYVGRLELLKGVHYLLRAFSELQPIHAELRLVGPILPEMRPILARYASERVHALGDRAYAELPDEYRQADVFVFPSINDSFGRVLLEAMASGLPVIATNHSAGPDLLDEGSEGFVIPIRDVDALKAKIKYLYSARDEAREMGRRGRLRVLERFTLPAYGARLIKVLARSAEP